MKLTSTYILLLLLLLTNCRSPSDQIIDAFNTVDQSLEKSNNNLDKSIDKSYSTINSKRKNNHQLALNADTIYFAISKTNNLINGLKQMLQAKDTAGTNTNLATNILVKTKTGDNLTKALNNVYAFTSSYFVDDIKKEELNKALQALKEIQNDKNWTKKYFEHTPTIAAVTILAKFQNDCTTATAIVLTNMEEHLK